MRLSVLQGFSQNKFFVNSCCVSYDYLCKTHQFQCIWNLHGLIFYPKYTRLRHWKNELWPSFKKQKEIYFSVIEKGCERRGKKRREEMSKENMS